MCVCVSQAELHGVVSVTGRQTVFFSVLLVLYESMYMYCAIQRVLHCNKGKTIQIAFAYVFDLSLLITVCVCL